MNKKQKEDFEPLTPKFETRICTSSIILYYIFP